jgi:hypothetical protein
MQAPSQRRAGFIWFSRRRDRPHHIQQMFPGGLTLDRACWNLILMRVLTAVGACDLLRIRTASTSEPFDSYDPRPLRCEIIAECNGSLSTPRRERHGSRLGEKVEQAVPLSPKPRCLLRGTMVTPAMVDIIMEAPCAKKSSSLL